MTIQPISRMLSSLNINIFLWPTTVTPCEKADLPGEVSEELLWLVNVLLCCSLNWSVVTSEHPLLYFFSCSSFTLTIFEILSYKIEA